MRSYQLSGTQHYIKSCHQIQLFKESALKPILSSSRDVRLFVTLFVTFPCDSPRGANEVPGEQSPLQQWHQYPEKMLRLTIGPQSI